MCAWVDLSKVFLKNKNKKKKKRKQQADIYTMLYCTSTYSFIYLHKCFVCIQNFLPAKVPTPPIRCMIMANQIIRYSFTGIFLLLLLFSTARALRSQVRKLFAIHKTFVCTLTCQHMHSHTLETIRSDFVSTILLTMAKSYSF